MRARIFLISLLCMLGCIRSVYANDVEKYLKAHQLYEAYLQKVKVIREDKYIRDKLSKFNNTIKAIINSSFNDSYKQAYLYDFIVQFPDGDFSRNIEFSSLYGVRFDPLGSINYLENLDNRDWRYNFQLMVLLQVYQPEKIDTDLYKNIAKESYEELLAYFASDQWGVNWRKDEYFEIVGADYQACYANLKCLLNAIPYWRNSEVVTYIPCQIAQNYDKVAYMDSAQRGHGAQSFMISDCSLYDKYKYTSDLESYVNKLFYEGLPDSNGSNRFYHQAKAMYTSLILQYSPKFDLVQQKRWDLFPYTEWAVNSYYNFSKYNEILNWGIGYKKALNELTQHYVTNFGVSKEQAYNTALVTLQIPSMDSWELIGPDNLYYMLLTGQPWSKIELAHKDIKGYSKLLEFSVAYPSNIQEIIRSGKILDENFDIDESNWFGKTPLMLAAQYGFLGSVKLLLENGADINRQTFVTDCWDGNANSCITHGKRTALMYAAQEGQFDVVKYLVQQGADVSLQDTKGLTAYDYMVGTKFEYNAHIKPTINGGRAISYWDDEKSKSAFSVEQIRELAPLLKGKK